jgi:hypothetical protein
MAVDETLLRSRAGIKPRSLSPSEINDSVRAKAPEPETKPPAPEESEYQPPPKKSDPLPKPGDGYRAHARFLNRLGNEQKLIHFVSKDFVSDGFAYSDLRRVRWVPPAHGGSPVIELRFVEAVVTEVRVEGRNLEDIHYWISEGVMPWLWEQPKGFKAREDGTPVITRITIAEVEKQHGDRAESAPGDDQALRAPA